jgi:hypothetical protein
MSLDGSNWTGLGSMLPLSGNVALVRTSAWETIPAAAKVGDINVRVVTVSGDGVADPVVRNLMFQVI